MKVSSFVLWGNRLLSNNANLIQTSDAVRCRTWRSVTSLLLLVLASAAHSQQPDLAELDQAEHTNYRENSDAELTQMVKNWASLSPTQRRLLLSEIRSRMKSAKAADASVGTVPADKAGSKSSSALNQVITQQSYGRTLRRPDGSLVTETETIKITPRGRQVTRQTTITPAKSARNGAHQPPNQKVDEQVTVSASTLTQPRRVMRTKIRFGTGFEQRHSSAASPAAVAQAQDKQSGDNTSSSEPQR